MRQNTSDENDMAGYENTQAPEPVLPHLSKYRCHKEVRAARIETVDPGDAGLPDVRSAHQPFLVLLSDPTYAGAPDDTPMVRLDVTSEWLDKHKPQVGGYFVVYEDGYTSYSPAKAFVEGYTLIPTVEDKVEGWLAQGRCGACGWTLDTGGCAPGDCGFRPDDPQEQRERSECLAYLKTRGGAAG